MYHSPVRSPERVSVVASLPPRGPWRRALALERAGGEPRAVVLSYVPPEVIDDPARLAALVRDVEVAGRLHHPCAVQVLGTDAAGDALVIMEAFRPAETLRALLDAAGRLPPAIAARIVADACAAVASAHAIDAGEGQPLVHGALSPELIGVGHDGAALVSGFGAGGGGVPSTDVRALAAVLHECLSGEPPAGDEGLLAVPGIPPALAQVVSRVFSGELRSVEDLGSAIAGAERLAAHAEVMAYSEAILPAARGERTRPRDEEAAAGAEAPEEAGDDLVAGEGDPARRTPAPEPLPPVADAARVFAAPAPPPASRSLVPLVVAACALLGFGVGLAAARGGLGKVPPPAPAPGAAANEVAGAYAPAPPEAAPAPAPPAPATTPPEPPRAAASARPAERAPPRKVASAAPGASAPARRASPPRPVAKGVLAVTAPDEAEVFLDGRPVGSGSLRRDVPPGAHLIEVRLGEARVAERFEVAPGETWTYEVTPTP